MIFVAVGGFFGAISRYLLGQWIHRYFTGTYPFAMFFINSFGSFLLGMLMASEPQAFRYSFLAAGFLGAFTTFSTFSYEAATLLLKNHVKQALFYIGLSTITTIAAAFFGYYIIFRA